MYDAIFSKVEQRRIYEEVARQIQKAIISQKLKPGDKLPSQKELMDLFQVSKITIIKAIGALEQAGLVYTKYGATGGTFVSELSTGGFSESLRLLLSMRRVTFEELAECRLTIEGQAAHLAAKRRRSEDLKKMDHLLNAMSRLLGLNRPAEEIREIESSFHLVVAKASHNNLFMVLTETINDCFMKEIRLHSTSRDQMEKDYAGLKKIYEAIKARNAKAAEKATKEHINQCSEVIISQYKEKHPRAEVRLTTPAGKVSEKYEAKPS